MLRLPEGGLKPYRDGHRTDLSIFCDWLEGSLLFTSHNALSLSDIKDVLMEEHLYKSQDKASEFLADVWREFDRRNSALGQSYPIKIENLRLLRMMTWRQSPAYAFCLLLSFAEHTGVGQRDSAMISPSRDCSSRRSPAQHLGRNGRLDSGYDGMV